MLHFRPLYDHVVVRRIAEKDRSKGGIIIPDAAKEKPAEGEVLAVGNGARGEDGFIHALTVDVGEHVVFGKYAGTELTVEGEDIVILRECDILGVIEVRPS